MSNHDSTSVKCCQSSPIPRNQTGHQTTILHLFVVVVRKCPETYCIPRAANRVRGAIQPHKFTCGSALAAANAATWGPRLQSLGHGLRHHTHLAAGLKQHRLYTVHNAAQDLRNLTPQSRGRLRVTPRGLSDVVPQDSTTQHFGLFIPRH